MSTAKAAAPKAVPMVFASGNTIGENDKYKKVRTIGKGSFGMAILCKHSTLGNVVVKKVEVKKKGRLLRNVIQEVMVMKKVKHPNIIGFYDVWQSSNAIYLALEYATAGDLEKVRDHYIAKQICISEPHLRSIAWQVCNALDHLHSLNIVHRDVKSANIFLTSSGVVKLGDFGLSKTLDTPDGMCKTKVGTPYYMPPEVIQGKPYTSSCDVWALGILLYELMYFMYPFMSADLKELQAMILTHEVDYLPANAGVVYSEMLVGITESCLVRDPSARTTASSILKQVPPPKLVLPCSTDTHVPTQKKSVTKRKSCCPPAVTASLEQEEAYQRYLIVQEAFQIHTQWEVMCNWAK
eukprot:TRINITY_DN6815_c0_g1_i1.p1 TRINITY_DN6815_c0_g1~~TRINITY_DN6815_c0_g1_i1.p1  ORF type:complete len:352 (+),score=106.28 TRINITY_DN6815_c0_g1_i1:121-1176(+)